MTKKIYIKRKNDAFPVNKTGLSARPYIMREIDSLYGQAPKKKLSKSKLKTFCDGAMAKAKSEVIEELLSFLVEERKSGETIEIDYIRGELHKRISDLTREYKLRGGVMSISSCIETSMMFDPGIAKEMEDGKTVRS